ncbi:hypothetical protein SSX86_019154 [Deinandra increscens subsp. villosa]|uniref:Fe2OG dioxygenase domain-containing protein n=1 Tax=Deinandra increscens subsp. villosa TaxID=3103831 RepID=A0AAP0CWV7_9ASTR
MKAFANSLGGTLPAIAASQVTTKSDFSFNQVHGWLEILNTYNLNTSWLISSIYYGDIKKIQAFTMVIVQSIYYSAFTMVIGLFSTIMGREPDPGWAHGTHVQGTKNSVLCKFCGFKSTGGITRHKHHLAWDSSEVSKCPKVPPDVKQFFKELFEKSNQAKEAENRIPHFDDVVDLEEDDEDEIPSFNEGQSKGKRPIPSSSACASNKKTKGPLDKNFKPSVTSGKKGGHLVGSVQHKEVQKKLRLEAVQLFCRWLYDAGLPFNSLKYDSLGPAIEAIGRYGCGMKPPSYHEVRVPMLKLEVEHTRKILEENEVEKATYGCSLMADGWRDRRRRALINFLVNTPRGSMFIESVDASSYSHTGDNMFKLFDQFIQKVGSESVIRIVTDSASNNVRDAFRRVIIGKCKEYHNISANSLRQTQPFSLILPGAESTNSACESTMTELASNLTPSHEILGSGMIILKNYISLKDQVEIVNICQKLGLGPGGFYQATYQSGVKQRLHRMCFGRNWDPVTKYSERYRSDGSLPPPVPDELISLVQTSIQDAQAHLNSANEIPLMCPNICLVNFYTTLDRLGLHQDRNESPDSLRRGLPVVSLSIGDSAEFLYGHTYTENENELSKVVLESGDVMIFGGKSRLIYHGVKTIFPNSAPLSLLQKTKLRPGRLNLTFREY